MTQASQVKGNPPPLTIVEPGEREVTGDLGGIGSGCSKTSCSNRVGTGTRSGTPGTDSYALEVIAPGDSRSCSAGWPNRVASTARQLCQPGRRVRREVDFEATMPLAQQHNLLF